MQPALLWCQHAYMLLGVSINLWKLCHIACSAQQLTVAVAAQAQFSSKKKYNTICCVACVSALSACIVFLAITQPWACWCVLHVALSTLPLVKPRRALALWHLLLWIARLLQSGTMHAHWLWSISLIRIVHHCGALRW